MLALLTAKQRHVLSSAHLCACDHSPGSCSGTLAYRTGRQGEVVAVASSSAEESCPSEGHAREVLAFREHADSTNDIFLVAAQAVTHTLLRARAAVSGESADLLSADLWSAAFW